MTTLICCHCLRVSIYSNLDLCIFQSFSVRIFYSDGNLSILCRFFVCIISCFYISLNLAVDNRLSFEASTGSIYGAVFLYQCLGFCICNGQSKGSSDTYALIAIIAITCQICTCAGLCNYILIYLCSYIAYTGSGSCQFCICPISSNTCKIICIKNIDSYCSCNSYVGSACTGYADNGNIVGSFFSILICHSGFDGECTRCMGSCDDGLVCQFSCKDSNADAYTIGSQYSRCVCCNCNIIFCFCIYSQFSSGSGIGIDCRYSMILPYIYTDCCCHSDFSFCGLCSLRCLRISSGNIPGSAASPFSACQCFIYQIIR